MFADLPGPVWAICNEGELVLLKIVAWIAHHLETRDIVMGTIRRIGELLAGHQFEVCESRKAFEEHIVDADIMFGYKITPTLLPMAQRLKWIQFGSAGIDHTVFPGLLQSDIIITTMSGIHAIPVAEHTISMMLALSRHLHTAAKLQSEHCYDRAELAAQADELYDKTVGIVGLGKIGLNIARLAKAFGMRVVGSKITRVECLPNVDKTYTPDQLHEMLAECDYLVLAVPLTQNTASLIGESEIAAMKDGARIINIARGAMLDHAALGDALKSGKLAGAALDVFPAEPLTADSEIYNLPNVIITPHTAASSPQYSARASEIFRTNFRAYISGEPMINVYDKKRGY